jgi:hypothetical protein
MNRPLPPDIAAREEPDPRGARGGASAAGIPQFRDLYDPAMFPPPGGTEFVLTNPGVVIAAGASAELAEFEVPPGHDGVLRYVCFSEMAPDDPTGFSITLDGDPTAWRDVIAPPSPTNSQAQADVAMCLRIKGGQVLKIIGQNDRAGGGADLTATVFAYGYVWPESLTRMYRQGV